MEIFMYRFLRVSSFFFSQNEWLEAEDQRLPRYLVFGGCTKIKITGRETMGTQHWFPSSDWRQAFCHQENLSVSSLERTFLILPRNLHHKGGRQLYEPWQSRHPPALRV